MLMIDPKVVELAVFDGIPHMLLPVVTDMKQGRARAEVGRGRDGAALPALRRRGSKNIITFNRKVERVIAGELPPDKFQPRRVGKVTAQGINGEEVLMDPDDDEVPDALEPAREAAVHRGGGGRVRRPDDGGRQGRGDVHRAPRAEGTRRGHPRDPRHAAPQRRRHHGHDQGELPVPHRLQGVEPAGQQDHPQPQGAEHLLGRGDMLMIPPGSSDLQRVHSAFIDEHEVEKICDHLREQGKPTYDENILKPRDDEEGMPASESDDPLYDKAVAVVAEEGTCSISRLQRKLKVGYNKAASLVEMMEQHGIVGPPNGKAGGRREVLIQAH
jgi:S-DNA-T family DNA segregation ATPase FtsK/SpoIIIE